MAAKRKNVSSRHQRLARQRAAAESRRRGQKYAGCPAEIVELLQSPYILPQWEAFYRAFPRPEAAVEAARHGAKAEIFCSEHEFHLMRVVVKEDIPWVESTLYVPQSTRDALWSGLLHSDDPAETMKRIIEAMPCLLPDNARLDDIECISETAPADARLPRFAYRYRVPVADGSSWKSVWDASRRYDGLHRALGWMDQRAAGHAEAVTILRRHSVPAVSCAACGHAVTNRHPAWPGLWVDLMKDECGPLCLEWDDTQLETEDERDTITIGGPHRVEDAPVAVLDGLFSLTVAADVDEATGSGRQPAHP